MIAPRATVRLQLHAGFTMEHAAALADYFAELGVSHLYLSPILQAAPGSEHGYDCVDPSRIDAARGGEAGFDALVNACAKAGLGLVVDIVPNHLDVSCRENRLWWSVLRLGRASPHARVFDIDWQADPSGRLVLPVLGKELDEALGASEFALRREGGTIELSDGDHRWPLERASVADLLDASAAAALSETAAQMKSPAQTGALADLDALSELDRHLEHLLQEDAAAAAALDDELLRVSRCPQLLREVIDRQHYRLVFWRTGLRKMNYRRFFDISNLAAVRVEDPAVFGRTHRLVLDWVSSGRVQGLRVDHPDGLRDPARYFERLAGAAPGAWIIAEKILEDDEQLPEDWAVEGTTGYEFLNDVLGLLVNPQGLEALADTCRRFTGEGDFRDLRFQAKWEAARQLLAAELGRLVRLLASLAGRDARLADDPERLADAVALMATCTPVYRTYAIAEKAVITERDASIMRAAHEDAARRRPELAASLGAIRDLLLLEVRDPAADEFVARFQQYTAPVMAKGVEDTAHYRDQRLVAMNEVGGSARHALTVRQFHERNHRRADRWPHTMLSSSTHDTKRSGDVRARLALLSEIPGAWADAVHRWARITDRHRTGGVPDRAMEHLLYQTLVGAWPIDAQRAVDYMQKAAREAKVRTSWHEPDTTYEAALCAFVENALADESFTAEIAAFTAPLMRWGRVNSLAQTLLKLTAPGVPDIYQGTELWDLSLVDPDNRRPVDYAERRRLLAAAKGMTPQEAMAWMDAGLPKLWLTQRVLHVRRQAPQLFHGPGGYEPLEATGVRSAHVVAFLRSGDVRSGDMRSGGGAITIVPRLVATLGGDWADTSLELPEGAWHDVLAGQQHRGRCALTDLLEHFPVALLVRVGAERRV